jgi:hypothetical protein
VHAGVVVLAAGAPLPTDPARGEEGCSLVHPSDDVAGLPARLSGASRHLLVLGEQRDAHLVGRACSLVSAAHPDLAVVARPLPHGLLAVRLLADLVGSLRLPPAVAVATLDALAADTFSGAWLPTVANLVSPQPTLTQHLRSWLPGGGGYLVEHAPRPSVRAAKSAAHGDAPHAGSGSRPALVVAGTGAPDTAVRQAQRLAAAATRVQVEPLPGLKARYGTAAAVELAALPEHPPALSLDAAPRCPTCGLAVPQPVCPFCRRSTAAVTVRSAT